MSRSPPLIIQMFAEFTELFSAHRCTGRQHFTSSVVPSLCGSLIVVAAWLSVKFAINNPHTITKLIIVRVPIVVFKIFAMRFLERGCVFCFLSHLVTLPSRASVILFSKKPPNYFAAACIDRGRIVLSIFVQIVTPRKRRLRHFCVALAITRKFRLCLHPRGMLRVQSLHLPQCRTPSMCPTRILTMRCVPVPGRSPRGACCRIQDSTAVRSFRPVLSDRLPHGPSKDANAPRRCDIY